METKTISEKFALFTDDRDCNKRFVSVKNKTPVIPGSDIALEWQNKDNRYTWEKIQMIPGDYGIILDKTGLCCIDFDKCINGEVSPEVSDILQQLDTWTEISQSGRGLHAWIITDANTPNRKPGGCYEIISGGHVRLTGKPFPPYADRPIKNVDGDTLTKILKVNPSVSMPYTIPAMIKDGMRNTELHKMACSLANKGLSDSAVMAAVMTENKTRCDIPLPDDEVRTLVMSACQYVRRNPAVAPVKVIDVSETPIEPPLMEQEQLTEVATSDLFLKIFVHRLRYCYGMKRWLAWDETRWQIDRSGIAQSYCKMFVKYFYKQAGEYSTEEERRRMFRHAEHSNSASGIENILRCSQPDVSISEDKLDADGYLLNLQNGTFDLRTLTLRPHNKDDLLTKIANVTYDPEADCPVWKEHIKTVFDGDADLITQFQDICGYALAGIGNPRAGFFVLYGKGRNGKTVTMNVLSSLMGDYSTNISPVTLQKKKGETVRTDLLHMMGARIVTCSEPSKSIVLDDGVIKDITGGNVLTARHLYGEEVDFRMSGCVFFAGNYKPRIDDQTVAMWNRIWLIPFTHYFPPEEQDADILDKLKREYAGILNWMVQGWKRYQLSGLTKCKKVADETKEYQNNEDNYHEFLKQYTINKNLQIKGSKFFKDYLTWCDGQGIKPVSITMFGREMASRFTKRHTDKGVVYDGIGDGDQITFIKTDGSD
jgi:putative DNA primase/helicase